MGRTGSTSLDDWDRLKIEGISGTSAGAMNAAALAQGFVHGGTAKGAQAALNKFWEGVGRMAAFELPCPQSVRLDDGQLEYRYYLHGR